MDKLYSLLEPYHFSKAPLDRPDDQRLGECVEHWTGDFNAIRQGRAVLLGFPQDEGVGRNGGRKGAARAPDEIRGWLYRFTPWDFSCDLNLADHSPLDLGNLRIIGDLEISQQLLGRVIAEIITRGAIPIVLGGGHETAFGHYLGYVLADQRVGIINVDAHLDVRPFPNGQGHSGSPFRQALEHPTHPLPGSHYACLGAQSCAVGQNHWQYVHGRGGIVIWADNKEIDWVIEFERIHQLQTKAGCKTYLSIDADCIRQSDMPGVSAPNPCGLEASAVLDLATVAGAAPAVASFDLVEVNPLFDRDGQSARLAGLIVRNLLIGIALRRRR